MVLDKIEHERDRLRLERQRLHNQNFGSIFVSTTSPTLFAFSLMVGWCDCYKATLGHGVNIVVCWGSAMWTSTRPTSRTSWRTHRTTGSLRPADCYRTRIQRSCCSGAH